MHGSNEWIDGTVLIGTGCTHLGDHVQAGMQCEY